MHNKIINLALVAQVAKGLHELRDKMVLKSQKQTAQLDLVPNLANPKNLFSLLLSPENVATISSKASANIEDETAALA